MTDITYGTFLFFGTSVVVGIIFAYFYLPETKEVALEDMDILFSIKGSARHMRREADRLIALQREEQPGNEANMEKLDTKSAHVESTA